MTLRVTLEIVPYGNEALKREIEVINISNEGAVNLSECIYAIEHNDYKNASGKTPRVKHTREEGALVLVKKALEKLVD